MKWIDTTTLLTYLSLLTLLLPLIGPFLWLIVNCNLQEMDQFKAIIRAHLCISSSPSVVAKMITLSCCLIFI